MNKSRILVIVALLAILGLGYAVQTGNTAIAQAVPIPEELSLWVAGIIFVAVTAGFDYLFKLVGLDFREYAAPLAGTISFWLISELQGWINLINSSYDGFVTIVFQILVVIVGGIGTLFLLKMRRDNGSALVSGLLQ